MIAENFNITFDFFRVFLLTYDHDALADISGLLRKIRLGQKSMKNSLGYWRSKMRKYRNF